MNSPGVVVSFLPTRGVPTSAITGAGIFVNGIANYAFIFGKFGAPALGLEGAAIATILFLIMSIFIAWYLRGLVKAEKGA